MLDSVEKTVVIPNLYVPSVINFSYASPVCNTIDILKPVAPNNFNAAGSYSATASLIYDSEKGFINISASPPGTYQVLYLLPGVPGCSLASSSTASILIQSAPVLTVSPDGSTGPVSLQVIGGTTYTWSPETNLSCDRCDNPLASPLITTNYCVSSQISGCKSTACVTVLGCEGDESLTLPNAFSPNGDGLNDEFCLEGWSKCTSNFNVLIFDRWGEKVYESTNPAFCWNGIYKDKPLNADVYICVIKAQVKDRSISRKANITLLR